MANLIHIETQEYPVSTTEFLSRFPNLSFPVQVPYGDYGYAVVFPYPTPSYDPITQYVSEIAPALTALGTYEQRYEVLALDTETIANNQAKKTVDDAKVVADKIDQLWRAADAYERGYISGVAVGLLTIGVIQQLPISLSIAAWSGAHWTEYFTRKAAVTLTSVLDLDFTTSGPMPFSVPELRTELGM